MPSLVAEYLSELTLRLEAQLERRLAGAWLIGSGALGDFDALRSDVDVQAVSTMRLARPELERLAAALSPPALRCPVCGLEFVLYAREDLLDVHGPAFQLNLNTGPRMEHHVGYEPDAEPRFWFVLDTAIARERARPLAGLSPTALLPPPPRPLVLSALRAALAWMAAMTAPRRCSQPAGRGPGRGTAAGCRRATPQRGRPRSSRTPRRWPRRLPVALTQPRQRLPPARSKRYSNPSSACSPRPPTARPPTSRTVQINRKGSAGRPRAWAGGDSQCGQSGPGVGAPFQMAWQRDWSSYRGPLLLLRRGWVPSLPSSSKGSTQVRSCSFRRSGASKPGLGLGSCRLLVACNGWLGSPDG